MNEDKRTSRSVLPRLLSVIIESADQYSVDLCACKSGLIRGFNAFQCIPETADPCDGPETVFPEGVQADVEPVNARIF